MLIPGEAHHPSKACGVSAGQVHAMECDVPASQAHDSITAHAFSATATSAQLQQNERFASDVEMGQPSLLGKRPLADVEPQVCFH